ncbi:hypothetical protein B0J18DRAFT_414159 [Chaetomium sp. MPI-SDFR-AT-0129]|nr:hypothetical protein B0J18DRAFT_414159 [Chaetomium sp. MPI-SDFR-AT-0129]
MFSTLPSQSLARRATKISLDRQVFYTPAAAAVPKPASCGPRAREERPPAAILGVSLTPSPLQSAQDLQPSSARGSQADAILIPTDNELNDLDGRSDISFGSLSGLLSEAYNTVQPGRVSDTGKGVDATSDDHNASEPLVTSIASLGNESCPKHPNGHQSYYRFLKA